jgi:hypothetical protein
VAEQLKTWIDVSAAEDQLIGQIRDRIAKDDKDFPRIGLAFSGGGIRSAIFCLGITQKMHEIGMLKAVQYLSTVSGGGYIGSWLITAFKKQRNEAVLEPASPELHHLRQYSRYLAPQSGAASPDAWTIWTIWLRNAALIQIAVILALGLALLIPRAGVFVFDWFASMQSGQVGLWTAGLISILTIIVALGFTRSELKKDRIPRPGMSQNSVVALIVVPIALSAGFAAVALYAEMMSQTTVAQILGAALTLADGLRSLTPFEMWRSLAPGILFFIMALMFGPVSLPKDVPNRWGIILLAAVVVFVVGEAGFLCAVWLGVKIDFDWQWTAGPWWPLIGPSLILIVFGKVVVLFIGILGRGMPDEKREWWSRVGAWLFLLSAAGMFLCIIALAAPELVRVFWARDHKWLTSSAVLAWIGSTVASVLGANSPNTPKDPNKSNRTLDAALAFGPIIFIAGLLILLSGLLEMAVTALASPWASDLGIAPYIPNALAAVILFVVIGALGLVAWLRFDLNEFSMNHFYRNRLVRCFMGASNSGAPNAFTGLNFEDDYNIADLVTTSPDQASWTWQKDYSGPFPIVNTALNTPQGGDLDQQDRKAESFVFTPAYSGKAGSCWESSSAALDPRRKGCYRPTSQYIYRDRGIHYGTAIAISGAAASPNMGYHTSPGLAFLLTLFNVRLGWWVPNPCQDAWQNPSPGWYFLYLVKELFGASGFSDQYQYLSDGGHFENLGVYELVRRKCDIVIACDGEQDNDYNCESLAGVIRKCWIDFKVKIDIDVAPIRARNSEGWNGAHYAVGTIHYPDGQQTGKLIYLKSSMTGNEPIDLMQYKATHSDFPHQSTADQFFTQDQFESYRHLGELVADAAFQSPWERCGKQWKNLPEFVARASASKTAPTFSQHTQTLARIWKQFKELSDVQFLHEDLFPGGIPFADISEKLAEKHSPVTEQGKRQAYYLSQEMIQLMEDVYNDLSLEETYLHPDNSGWMNLFCAWSKSTVIRESWRFSCHTFGKRFQDFCFQRFGMERCPPGRKPPCPFGKDVS